MHDFAKEVRTARTGKLVIAFIIISVILTLCMVFSTSTASAASDPAVTVVNPVSGSTIYSNSLLISVKLTAPETIKVNLYKQVKHDATGTPVAITYDEWERHKEELAAIASGSATITAPSITALNGWVMEPVVFSSTSDLSFFTKKVENLSYGIYKISIDTIAADGSVIYNTSQYVILKEKAAAPEPVNVFQNSQTGTVNFLQNLLRSIFGN